MGIEAKLSWVGWVMPIDGPVIADDGEARSCGAYTLEHDSGIRINYEL